MTCWLQQGGSGDEPCPSREGQSTMGQKFSIQQSLIRKHRYSSMAALIPSFPETSFQKELGQRDAAAKKAPLRQELPCWTRP